MSQLRYFDRFPGVFVVSRGGSTVLETIVDAHQRPLHATFGNITAQYFYRDNGDMASMNLVDQDGSVIQRAEFEYDRVGRLVQAQGDDWGPVSSDFDAMSRLRGASAPGLGNLTFRFLDSGAISTIAENNVVVAEREFDDAERVVRIGALALEYNDDVTANVASVSQGGTAIVTLSHDGDNRATEINDTVSGRRCRIEYTPAGVLMRLRCSGPNTTSWYFVTDPIAPRVMKEYFETDGGGDGVARTLSYINAYDDGGRLMMQAEPQSDTYTWYVRGPDESVWAILQAETTAEVRFPLHFAAASASLPRGRMEWIGPVLLRQLWEGSFLYITDRGRVYDAHNSVWLSAPTTDCNIGSQLWDDQKWWSVVSNGGGDMPSNPHGWAMESRVIDYWSKTSGVSDATVGTLQRAHGGSCTLPRVVPAWGSVEVVAPLTGSGWMADALVIDHLPGDSRLSQSRVAIRDVTSAATFVAKDGAVDDAYSADDVAEVFDQVDGAWESIARCSVSGDCGGAGNLSDFLGPNINLFASALQAYGFTPSEVRICFPLPCPSRLPKVHSFCISKETFIVAVLMTIL